METTKGRLIRFPNQTVASFTASIFPIYTRATTPDPSALRRLQVGQEVDDVERRAFVKLLTIEKVMGDWRVEIDARGIATLYFLRTARTGLPSPPTMFNGSADSS